MVQDFRKLNSILENEPYCGKSIDMLLSNIPCGDSYFIQTDFKLAYHQVPLDNTSKKFTAFTIPNVGSFELNSLALGISSSAASYYNTLEYIFGSLKQDGGFFTYNDDVLIWSRSPQDLIIKLYRFLELVEYHNMSLSAKKCSFGYKKVQILGIETDGHKFWLPDSRLKVISQLKPPRKKTLPSLIRFMNYFRRQIPNYARLCHRIL